MKCLFRLSETSASEDVKEAASVMVSGVNNVVQSARSQALKGAAVTDSHSSLVPLPVFSMTDEPERSSYIALDEEEEFLSPEERLERREAIKLANAEDHYKRANQVSCVE